jgi:RES domain-containing protein
MIEKLVHFSARLPAGQCFIEISTPAGTSCEVVTPDLIPGWAEISGETPRSFGRSWYQESRSALLFVPSFAAGTERNFVFNTGHQDGL